jgi:hypothetical protein
MNTEIAPTLAEQRLDIKYHFSRVPKLGNKEFLDKIGLGYSCGISHPHLCEYMTGLDIDSHDACLCLGDHGVLFGIDMILTPPSLMTTRTKPEDIERFLRSNYPPNVDVERLPEYRVRDDDSVITTLGYRALYEITDPDKLVKNTGSLVLVENGFVIADTVVRIADHIW